MGPLRDHRVVEADHTELPGHLDAELTRGAQGAHRQRVGHREDRRGRLGQLQQPFGAALAVLVGELPVLDQILLPQHAGRAERGVVALEPLSGRDGVLRAGQHSDPAVAEVQEVLDRSGAALPVGGRDGDDPLDIGIDGDRVDRDQRQREIPAPAGVTGTDRSGHQDDALDAAGGDLGHPGPGEAGGGLVAADHDQVNVRAVRGLLGPLEHLQGVGTGEGVEVDQRRATPVALASFGLVAQVAGGLGDGLARGLSHVRATVHHLGGGGQGDPGLLRHLLQRDPLAARIALCHDLTSPCVGASAPPACLTDTTRRDGLDRHHHQP